jgi:hypothetical protein
MGLWGTTAVQEIRPRVGAGGNCSPATGGPQVHRLHEPLKWPCEAHDACEADGAGALNDKELPCITVDRPVTD